MLKIVYIILFVLGILVYPKIMEWMGSTSYGFFSCDKIANQPRGIRRVYLYCLAVYLLLVSFNFCDLAKIPIWILYLPLLFTIILACMIFFIFGSENCKEIMFQKNDSTLVNNAEKFSILNLTLLMREESEEGEKTPLVKPSLYDRICTYFLTVQIFLIILPIQYASIVFLLMCNLPNPLHSLKIMAAIAPIAWLLILVYLLSISSKWSYEFERRTLNKLLGYTGLYGLSNLISLPLTIFLCGAYTDFAGDTFKSLTEVAAFLAA